MALKQLPFIIGDREKFKPKTVLKRQKAAGRRDSRKTVGLLRKSKKMFGNK